MSALPEETQRVVGGLLAEGRLRATSDVNLLFAVGASTERRPLAGAPTAVHRTQSITVFGNRVTNPGPNASDGVHAPGFGSRSTSCTASSDDITVKS